MTRITRVEVITNTGRDYVSWEDDNDITYMLQDSNRTLKVFVGKAPPEQPMTEEENERYFEEAKQIVENHFAKKKMTETEKIRAEIKVLEKKLSLLEEIEKQPQTLFDVIRNLGYSVDCSWEIVDAVEAFQKSKENEQGTWNYDPDAKFRKQAQERGERLHKDVERVVKENMKWFEENPDKDPLDWLKPQTPEETEQSLKEAFREAVEQGVVSSVDTPKESWMDKPIDELVAILEKNPPECLKFQLGKTLEQLIERWWCDVFSGPHENWTMEECISDLCDRIFLWFPKEQNSEGTQRIETIVAVDTHNELLRKIKSKIHNKKDT